MVKPNLTKFFICDIIEMRSKIRPQEVPKMILSHSGLDLLSFVEHSIMVCSDFHIPQQDDGMIEWLKRIGEMDKVDALAIVGDFNNLDEFSRFLKGTNCKWPEEQKESGKVWRELSEVFKRVYLVPGNHPFRLNKQTNNVWGIKELIKLTAPTELSFELYTTDRNYMMLESNGVKWLLTHPEQYSKSVGRIAGMIARNHDINVVAAHSHCGSYMEQWEMGHRVISVDSFCMCDEEKVDYLKMNSTTFPKWTKGFLKIVGEEVEIFTNVKVKKEFNMTKTIREVKNGREGRIF